MSTRSETENVVYIDAILKSTQNSRVQWSVQLLSNFGGQIPNLSEKWFFFQGSTILSYYRPAHRTEKLLFVLLIY